MEKKRNLGGGKLFRLKIYETKYEVSKIYYSFE